jgi:hypothetical protein
MNGKSHGTNNGKGNKYKKKKNKHGPPNKEFKDHTSLSHDGWHYMREVLRFSALDNTSIGVLRRSGA